MKTTFSSGVIVTSQWLNGAQQIYFDGQDIDWHYNPLGLSSLITSGPDGLDSRYVTLGTDQPVLDALGLYVTGAPISGGKVVTGYWSFGYDPTVNPSITNIIGYAPKSYTTNDKYENANGTPTPTIPQKFAALDDSDLITKLVVAEWLAYAFDTLVVDNGVYESSLAGCNNYSGGSTTVCPL